MNPLQKKKISDFFAAYQVVGFVVVLCVSVAVLYGQFLWNPIVFDDLPFFMLDHEGNVPVSGLEVGFLELRSLPYATLAWGSAWMGLDLLHFRVENLLLHIAVVIALFFFLARLFDAVSGERVELSSSSRVLVFSAALLFSLHPVATYAVGYLVQRTILMSTLFSLLAMYAYIHGSVRKSRGWLWGCVFFYYLAVLSKEHAIMLPAAIFALTVLLHADWMEKIKQRWAVFCALAMIAIFVMLAKLGFMGAIYEPNAAGMLQQEGGANLAYPLSVLTQSWLFFKYIGLWFFPNPGWMSIDMREPFARSLLSPYLLAFVAFVAWGVGAFLLLIRRGRLGLAGFAMLFPWLMFMTELSTVRIQECFVLYRSYLWTVGFFVMVPLLFSLVPRRTSIFLIAVTAIAYFPVSMERLSTMSHPLLLWDDAEKLVQGRNDLPGAYRIYYNRGTELNKVDRYDEAIADFNRAIVLLPDFSPAYGNMGAAYLEKQEWLEAVNAFTLFIKIATEEGERLDMRPYYGRAMAYEKLGLADKAKLDYMESCRLGNKGCEKL